MYSGHDADHFWIDSTRRKHSAAAPSGCDLGNQHPQLILGSITEGDLPKHIRDLSEDSGLVGAEVTIAPVDDIFLNVQLSLPVRENIVAPMVIGGGSEIETSFLVYRP